MVHSDSHITERWCILGHTAAWSRDFRCQFFSTTSKFNSIFHTSWKHHLVQINLPQSYKVWKALKKRLTHRIVCLPFICTLSLQSRQKQGLWNEGTEITWAVLKWKRENDKMTAVLAGGRYLLFHTRVKVLAEGRYSWCRPGTVTLLLQPRAPLWVSAWLMSPRLPWGPLAGTVWINTRWKLGPGARRSWRLQICHVIEVFTHYSRVFSSDVPEHVETLKQWLNRIVCVLLLRMQQTCAARC